MINIAAPVIDSEERRAVNEVIESGMLAQGPKSRRTRKELGGVLRGKTCVSSKQWYSSYSLCFVCCWRERGR